MSTPIEIVPGLYRIPTTPLDGINAFMFVEPHGPVTLVDAGLKGAPPKIVRALEAVGRSVSDVERIVLTHAHVDHAGGLRDMRERADARVAAHAEEAGYVTSGRPPKPDPRTFGARVFAMLPGQGFRRCPVDEELTDEQILPVLGGVRVIHTPGHTPGHIALMHEPSGTLILGDALFNFRGLGNGMRWSCADVPLQRETAARLSDLDFEIAAFMHGREIREHARQRVAEYVKRQS